MLLNKIPVLDKGYVALIDSCNTTSTLRDIGAHIYNGEYPVGLQSFGSMTVVMKCPLFVQLTLSKYNFQIMDANTEDKVEAYEPNSGEIGAPEKSDNDAIADDISRTTAALLINPKAYQADGCDNFISQLISPISVYTTLIVKADYDTWCKFAYQEKFPTPIKAYTIALQQIIEAEWK
jgi:hypothetical protein